MLRTRLATNLLFNLLLAVWVFYDARTRRARKPLFAAVLTLLWGPLGLGLWASDRPLGTGETREGTAATIGRTFLLAWSAMVPAIFVLVLPEMADRAAVPRSFARRMGPVAAAAAFTFMMWAGPAVLAVLLGRGGRSGIRERGGEDVARPVLPLVWAAVGAGAAAFGFAIALSR